MPDRNFLVNFQSSAQKKLAKICISIQYDPNSSLTANKAFTKTMKLDFLIMVTTLKREKWCTSSTLCAFKNEGSSNRKWNKRGTKGEGTKI